MKTKTNLFAGLVLLLAIVATSVAGAATITIVNIDGPNEGFNDPTPAAPVGGNPGLTIGEQRLNVFQHAANIWGGLLPSPVEIFISAAFNPQTCTATAAVLGSAGATFVFRDFAGAEFPGTWYHSALADRRAEVELNPGAADINAQFNSNINGSPGCLGGRTWYYGYDGLEGANVELLPVVLHEMGHGLGFSTFVNKSTGAEFAGLPDIYEHYILDNQLNQRWTSLTNAQRQASTIGIDRMVWDGPEVFAATPSTLGPRQVVQITSPPLGLLAFGTAAFGPPISAAVIEADLVLADDGVAPGSDACTPIVNDVSGKIALIDRGTCAFVLKAAAAQAAGAVAVIIANNVAGAAPGLGGVDPSITIPVVSVSLADGNMLKGLLPGVTIRMGPHPTLLAGADFAHRPLLFGPNPVQTGSSVSHWDVSAFPDLLMEPAINPGLSSGVDLTLPHFRDIGWFPNQAPDCSGAFAAIEAVWPPNHLFSPVQIQGVTDPDGDPLTITVTGITQDEPVDGPGDGNTCPDGLIVDGEAQVRLERSGVGNGRVYAISFTATDDRGGSCDGTVLVSIGRDQGTDHLAVDDGQAHNSLGPCKGGRGFEGEQAVASFEMRLAGMQAGTATIEYALPAAGRVSLAVFDVAGRKVASLAEGLQAQGAHRASWNPGGLGQGMYFYRLQTDAGTLTRSVLHMN